MLERALSLTDRTAEILRDRIANGEFAPGDRLPSTTVLARDFGVSLGVIREALSRLKHDGLIESVQGAGSFVSKRGSQRAFRLDRYKDRDAVTLTYTFELREAIEGNAARLAATYRNQESLQKLWRSFEALDEAIASQNSAQPHDQDFHRAIMKATGNPMFADLWDFLDQNIRSSVEAGRKHSASVTSLRHQAQDEHRKILEAIEAGDPAAAEEAARFHVRQATKRLALPEIDRKWDLQDQL
ncbi:GntR family transcriptional regulator [Agaricicola taiwanensis]|uniref:GntR family transcriptional regulator n=1 Tax=Agaricicola taiwanensis TaxID=591372 RepID=A0A8J2VLM4_9RHOB|nr:FadR/GntR family transcriptional regulator [Agaricicola taiwanensis]GGE31158.1 GntR family transcriptional regulator [Agaricicola taiwanensis]